jgi:hypothetical protein
MGVQRDSTAAIQACDLVRREVWNNILIKFGVPVKLVTLVKMFLN